MVKDKRAHTGFRIHHEAFSKLHANLLRPEQFPDAGLIFQFRAGGIAETVTLSAIARSKSLRHGHFRWIGKAPVLAYAAVEPLRARFRRFNGQGLESVRFEIVAVLVGFLTSLPYAFTGCHHK